MTSAEKKIERTPVFKRLLDISQLGLVNRIFPYALYNRYTHSLGVMHVAYQMAQNMNLSDTEIQLLRLAGLLHDIGHYPLSHNVEQAYKNHYKRTHVGTKQVSDKHRIISPDILREGYNEAANYSLKLSGFKGVHHEAIGAIIIKTHKAIRNIIKNML